MVGKEHFELRLYAGSGFAAVDLVRVRKDEASVVVARTTTTSTSPVSVLKLDALGTHPFGISSMQKQESRLKRLKPTRVKVSLGFLSTEWDFRER